MWLSGGWNSRSPCSATYYQLIFGERVRTLKFVFRDLAVGMIYILSSVSLSSYIANVLRENSGAYRSTP